MDLYLSTLSKRYKTANRCEKSKILNELGSVINRVTRGVFCSIL